MGDNLAGLLLGQPVIHCSVEMICDLGDLPRSNQYAHGDKTSISRCEVGAQPQVQRQNTSECIPRFREQPFRSSARLGCTF